MIGPFRKTRRPKPPEFAPPRHRPHSDRRPALPCAPIRSDGSFRRAIEMGRARLLITGAVMAFAFTAVGARLIDLGAFANQNVASVQTHAIVNPDLRTEKATITDRNGVIVATSLTTTALAARPDRLLDPVDAARRLAQLFPELDESDLRAKLTSDSPFVYVNRKLTPKMEQAVMQLGIPGLEFERAETRVYPHGRLLSHILGYTDVDGKGLSGIERGLEDRLRASKEPLRLSIDLRFQHVVHDELSKAVEEYSAEGGAGIVMDVNTGEVMAMVSLPDFDPNHPANTPEVNRFNRATFGTYELGSTFKIFNTAMSLESGAASLNDGYDATNPIKISRFTISDYHAKSRYLTLPEIFVYSSNIGSAKMALDVGPPAQKAFMNNLGLLEPIALEIPETGRPMFPNPWNPINTMTIAYGHGLSVTPLHLANGVSAVLNGGELLPPTLLARDNAPEGRRVISERVSFDMRRLMRLNATEGSGKAALVPGYMVGGKTGTAEKPGSGGYKKRALISSFVAAFPMNSPRYVVYVVLDEPRGTKKTFGFATGGWVAAPAAGAIIERVGAIAGVKPVQENAPEIQHVFAIELPEETKKLASLQQ
ncbi:MAG TPA: penicillin-binding protein [Rhodospirillaceae bacterium]|nr:penicillin-binding protein [Rhodospirillaceae bacterium]MBB57407.1 penicillin-binding protein [Rhodospirillaceae bacterium]HAE04126.1 penicillin-binding protein [Rhodospirillaceae bacterium]HAJ19669.1 penicillin-binding protein [Rhodospirillaceae bacterium]HBM13690.1 penicillin-binding protein [Rhodospirillaceae bacterium]